MDALKRIPALAVNGQSEPNGVAAVPRRYLADRWPERH